MYCYTTLLTVRDVFFTYEFEQCERVVVVNACYKPHMWVMIAA